MEKILPRVKKIFPDLKIKSAYKSFESKNENIVIELLSGKRLFVKKFPDAHRAHHEQIAYDFFSSKIKSFLFLPIQSVKNEYILYPYIEEIDSFYMMVKKNSKNADINIINTITEEIDQYDDKEKLEKICPRAFGYNKQKIKKHLQLEYFSNITYIQKIISFIDKFDTNNINNTDLVHGDFTVYNILLSPNGEERYCVDWEGLARSDRYIDYASMYCSLYFLDPSYAFEFLQFLKNNNNFNIEKFTYFIAEYAIDIIHNNIDSKNVVKIYTQILSLFFEYKDNFIAYPLFDINPSIIDQFKENICIKKLKISPIDSSNLNPGGESLFLLSGERTEQKYVLKVFQDEKTASKQAIVSAHSHVFTAFNVPHTIYQSGKYLVHHYNIYQKTEGLNTYKEKDYKYCIHSTIKIHKDIVENGNKIPVNGGRIHWHKKKYLLEYIKMEELEKRGFYPIMKSFLENFNESNIDQTNVINERITLDKIRVNSDGDLFVMDWRYTPYFDINFDYVLVYMSFELSAYEGMKDEYLEQISKEPFFNKENFLYFLLEKNLTAIHLTNNVRFQKSKRTSFIDKLEKFMTIFEDDFKYYLNVKT